MGFSRWGLRWLAGPAIQGAVQPTSREWLCCLRSRVTASRSATTKLCDSTVRALDSPRRAVRTLDVGLLGPTFPAIGDSNE